MTASFSERWIAMKITELVNKILEDAEFVDMTRMMEEGMPYWPTQPAFEIGRAHVWHLRLRQSNHRN